jgi:zinc protease
VNAPETLAGKLLVEESHDLPLVHFQVVLPRGALSDPPGREGLTRLAARMLRRGTRRRATREIEDAIDGLGGELSIDTSPSYVRFTGSVIRKSLEPMLALVGELLREPSFPAAELELLKRETLAALVELCDSDAGLCSTYFRRALFRGHPYSRPVIGRRSSLEPIDLEQVVAHYQHTLARASRVVAFSGDIRPEEAERLTREHLAEPPGADGTRLPVPEPSMRPGRHLTIIDKPERTQTQIQIGRLGTHPRDADHTALLVGNAVFGGVFSSRLMKAVRSERGWSYGASSRLSIDRVREGFGMWTFPAATDAAACIALELELMEKWVEQGIDEDELAFAKSCMIKSYAFAVDTAEKRLEQAVELLLLDLPPDYFSGYVGRIADVQRGEVNEALRARLSPRDLVLAVLATERELGPVLRALPELASVEVIPFDQDT